MYDDRFYNLMGQVKDILKVVIEDYGVVCVRVVKGMFSQNNEVELYFIRDVSVDKGTNTYKFLSGNIAQR